MQESVLRTYVSSKVPGIEKCLDSLYRVEKTHRMPYVASLLVAEEPRILGLYCGK